MSLRLGDLVNCGMSLGPESAGFCNAVSEGQHLEGALIVYSRFSTITQSTDYLENGESGNG